MLASNYTIGGSGAAAHVSSPSLNLASVVTFQQFAAQVIERADLSRLASRVAVEKAARADLMEFARYELLEAETFVAVLRELGTPLPPMGSAAKASLDQITDSSHGKAFDTAYVSAEYENHAFLRDLAAAYLKGSKAHTADERHGRQLASIGLFAFTEHAGITGRILRELAD